MSDVSYNSSKSEGRMAQQDTEGKETATVSSDDARKGFADILARAGHRDERVIITLYGKEHAALIGMRDLERLRELDARTAAVA
jgi:prevent-host-death family protein